MSDSISFKDRSGLQGEQWVHVSHVVMFKFPALVEDDALQVIRGEILAPDHSAITTHADAKGAREQVLRAVIPGRTYQDVSAATRAYAKLKDDLQQARNTEGHPEAAVWLAQGLVQVGIDQTSFQEGVTGIVTESMEQRIKGFDALSTAGMGAGLDAYLSLCDQLTEEHGGDWILVRADQDAGAKVSNLIREHKGEGTPQPGVSGRSLRQALSYT